MCTLFVVLRRKKWARSKDKLWEPCLVDAKHGVAWGRAGGPQRLAVASWGRLQACQCHRAGGKNAGFYTRLPSGAMFLFIKEKPAQSGDQSPRQVCLLSLHRVRQSHYSPAPPFCMKAKGNLSLEHFQSNPTWGCFERLFCPLEGLFPHWWAELSEYSPPPVGELPGRTGAYALEKDPPVSLLGVHPEVHSKHAPPHRLLAHWKCSFGLMYNWAYQLCTKKALIQLGEICTDLPPFNSGALEMWWEGVSGRQSKDEISGGWKTMKRNSPSDKSRGVGHFHLKHVPRERRALKVTDFCKHFCSDGSQWNYCFLWKERNHSSLPYKIWSVYFSKYVPPRFAANHKRSWHFMIPYYKFQKRLSSPLKELLQKQRLGAGSVLKQRDSCI